MNITGKTRVFFVLANPVAQVRAPELFNHVFARFGVNATLVPVQVPADCLVNFVRSSLASPNVGGLLLSIPYKGAVLDLLDECDTAGRIAGAVNAVRRAADGRLQGALFDGVGFMGCLAQYGIACRDKRVLIIGAGGAASAIAVALAEGGAAEVAHFDPVPGKAAALANRLASFGISQARAAMSSDAEGYELIINASPLGLDSSDAMPVCVEHIQQGAAVVDILMKNQPTPLVRRARERGLTAVPGFEMLIQQTPAYLDFFGYADAADELRRDATTLRRVIYPQALLAA
ncbi:MAG: shikimate dehydrogenase [Betaproteobacteria bacterium]|nr:shikimate dehydrogenase [Betaproteobacteria bacterium]MDE2046804.1 shikimate dehydrogenase [Betaproteobacteria bacterium]